SHLLLVDRLHHRSGAAAARFFGQPGLKPAGPRGLALPGPRRVFAVVFALAAHPTVAPLGRQVVVEPGTNLFPEGLLFLSEAEIHDSQISRPQGWTGGWV